MSLKIAIGSDHAGFAYKAILIHELTKKGYKVTDFGTFSEESTDYPDHAYRVSKAVADGGYDRGILTCGTGMGMAIAANKVHGIRATAPWSVATAKLASQHNWCNVLCLSGRFISQSTCKRIVHAWLATPYEKGGRHERRIKKIRKIEAKS